MALNVTSTMDATSASIKTKSLSTVPNFDWTADWLAKEDGEGNTLLVNTLSPIDARTKIRASATRINNIYNNTGISPNYQFPTKDGVSYLIQLTSVLDVSDDNNAAYRAQLPISAHMVLKFPNNSLVTRAHIMQAIRGVVAFFSQTITSGTVGQITAGAVGVLNQVTNPVRWKNVE